VILCLATQQGASAAQCWGASLHESPRDPAQLIAVCRVLSQILFRACLKRSCSRCETPYHQVDHSDSDPRLRGLRQGLKVFTEPPRTIEPADGTFHDPAPLHDLKALGVPGALHKHEGSPQDRRHPRDELAGVPPIGPDQFQSRKVGDECPEHLFGPITVLAPHRMHYDDEEQPADIDDDVVLAPADALAALIAPAPPFSVVFTV
jgi:hypothetical protein